MMNDMARAEFVAYVERFIGLPYRYGGDDPMTGFDCSGLVVEGLQAVGVLEPKSDYTAAALWELFTVDYKKEVALPRNGALVFYRNKQGAIAHVAICKSTWLMIESGGGDSFTVDIPAAQKQNAFIRIRPISSRGNIAGYVDPFLG
jgi:cell wall-associated NlpC family hydrolase